MSAAAEVNARSLAALYEAGLTCPEIAKQVGLKAGQIQYLLHKHGVTFRPRGGGSRVASERARLWRQRKRGDDAHYFATTRARILDSSIPEPNSGCWLWLGAAGSGAHGRPGIEFSGKYRTASRVSIQVFRSIDPTGFHVLHRCDVGICVNPDHLFLGTPLENIRDMIAKGRASWQRSAA